MSDKNVVSIKNLSKSYKLDNGHEVQSLKNISLDVKEGEILGVIGTSGSGKSTLLRILRGVEEFDEGEVTVGRYTLKPDSTKYFFNQVKRETAIHLQRSFGIWPETALENVVRKLYAKKYRDESGCELDVAIKEFGDEAMELLKLVGLDHKSDHLASVLSGGEKQRLIMARQLAKKPKVMLLDEPATMACPKTKQDILNAIKKINDELGITIIIVSHLPEIHKYLADRVILLKDGEIEKEGDAEEIIEEFLAPIDDVCDIEIKSSDETVIKAIDLNKKFILLHGGEVLDIRDISFEVKRHDILSLVGVSGAGKTILLRMLGGLDVPDSGDVLFELEKDDECYAAYDSALVYDPYNLEVLNNYSYFLSLDEEDLQRALDMSKKTVETEPENDTFLDTYAWILFKMERYEEAKAYAEKIISLGVELSPVVLHHIGDIYAKCGDTEKAVLYWQKACDAGDETKILKKKIRKRRYYRGAKY